MLGKRTSTAAGCLAVSVLLLVRPVHGAEPSLVTVDPALLPAWELLTTVRGPSWRADGARYRAIAARAGVSMVVEEIPEGADAGFILDERRLAVSLAIVAEDPRAVAAVLAHEIRHVEQWLLGHQDDPSPQWCRIMEVDAIMMQNAVWAALWGEEQLPTRTHLERTLTKEARVEREGGFAALLIVVEREPVYQRMCAVP